MQIRVARLDPDLPLPRQQHTDDAGFDLHAREDVTLAPGGGRALVPTGLAVAIPPGYAGFVLPRSGLALQHGVTCLNTPGLIDPLYRGELKVLLVNTDPSEAYTVSAATASPSSSSSRSRRSSGSRSTSSTRRRATRSASAPPAASAPGRREHERAAPVPLRGAGVEAG